MVDWLIGLWLVVSIHAPVKGATRIGRLYQHSITRFNPRAREGRDVIIFNALDCFLCRFNPRAREGRDCWCKMHLSLIGMFQSTRP